MRSLDVEEASKQSADLLCRVADAEGEHATERSANHWALTQTAYCML